MKHSDLPLKAMLVLVSLILTAFLAPVSFGDEEHRKGNRNLTQSPSDRQASSVPMDRSVETLPMDRGVETRVPSPVARTGPVGFTADPVSALVEELRAARKSGDLEAVRRLERSLWKEGDEGEASGPKIRRPSATVSGPGDFGDLSGGLQPGTPEGGPQAVDFGTDRRVRNFNYDFHEFNQDMVSDSAGNLYVAWQDDLFAYDYIQVYWSEDDGITWEAYGYLANATAHLREPSLAVGEGNEDRILLAYIVDDGVSTPIPEAASAELGSHDFEFYSLYIWNLWEGYARPVIWTDSAEYDAWFAYVACEAVVDSGTGEGNINVCSWRGVGLGKVWDHEEIVMGKYDSDAWVQPHAIYNPFNDCNYIVCFNDTDNSLYFVWSSDYGATYSMETYIKGPYIEPFHPVEPKIAAAQSWFNDSLLICCTLTANGKDAVAFSKSHDMGGTWTKFYALNDTSTHPEEEFGVSLTSGPSGLGDMSYHLIYTSDHHVFYTRNKTSLNDPWDEPVAVDDEARVSHAYIKKGLAVNGDSGYPAIAWSDYRDGTGDYDTFFDSKIGPKTLYVPEDYATIQEAIDLAPEGTQIIVAPGTYVENLDFKGKYLRLESTKGAPLTVMDGGQAGRVITLADGEDPRIYGFTITNGKSIKGGGVYCGQGSVLRMWNCVVCGNSAAEGAGIYCDDADPELAFVTIAYNSASAAGGGLYSDMDAKPKLTNCILWGNTAPIDPQIYWVYAPSGPSISHCDIEGGWPWSGSGIIDVDPLFVNPAAGDYHLPYTSPCRDTGIHVDDWGWDFEGDQREWDFWDIGADEFHTHLYCTGNPVPGGMVSVNIVGAPKAAHVGLWIGFHLLDPALPGAYGYWYLLPPLMGPFLLGSMPPEGVKTLPGVLPKSVPGPYTFHMQALIGPPWVLTNPCTVEVQ